MQSAKIKDNLWHFLLLLSGFVAVFTAIGILILLLVKTYSFFTIVHPQKFFLDTVWTPLFFSQRFGIWPLIIGTLKISLTAILLGAPLGVFSAIYLSEFAKVKERKILKSLLEIFASIPTVVFGFFALMIVTPFLMRFIPSLMPYNALSPGIVIGFMLVPIIASLSEDAMSKTPTLLKEAAYSLGARKISVILKVVLPFAASGIKASVFLAFSRAMGETMVVSIASGLVPSMSADITKPSQTLTSFIIQVSMGDTPQDSPEFLLIFAVGFILFLLSFLFYGLSQNKISFARAKSKRS